MARTTMAPTLRQTVRNALGPTGDVYEERAWKAMDRELRALLRVARAAGPLLNQASRLDHPDLRGPWKRMARALLALDRVSGRQRKGGRP